MCEREQWPEVWGFSSGVVSSCFQVHMMCLKLGPFFTYITLASFESFHGLMMDGFPLHFSKQSYKLAFHPEFELG